MPSQSDWSQQRLNKSNIQIKKLLSINLTILLITKKLWRKRTFVVGLKYYGCDEAFVGGDSDAYIYVLVLADRRVSPARVCFRDLKTTLHNPI